MTEVQIQYVADAEGKLTSVLVPIELWHAIEAELETAYLQQSDKVKKRLLEVVQQQRPFGSAKGQIMIMPDFDEPLEEFKVSNRE